jgi:hypothetical protein
MLGVTDLKEFICFKEEQTFLDAMFPTAIVIFPHDVIPFACGCNPQTFTELRQVLYRRK